VALQAQQVDVAEPEHVRIWPAVDHVARLTPIHLYRRMFVYERALFLRVACKANCILRRGIPNLLGADRSVDVVAVAALNQSFVHPVMERHCELGLLVQMARVTKLWLSFDQQEFLGFGVVWRMARYTANVVF
jgi:hypothetical protein